MQEWYRAPAETVNSVVGLEVVGVLACRPEKALPIVVIRLFPVCLLLLSAVLPVTAERLEFNRDIRPILSDKCFVCHGPDDAKRVSGLRLDVEADAKKDLGGRFGLKPGDPEQSEVYKRLVHDNDALRMPPAYAVKKTTPEEIELVRRWIEQGAEYQSHWAFETPRRPEPPAVENEEWARNEIDRFVLARLESEGLTPSPEADRAELLRRVSFDLTGLPPSLEELDAYLADDSPQAYENAVDRLLDSPRYGERMAIRWLDASRYADTNGYQTDAARDQWRWRDWVIDAFNRNLPFDQFTVEQLAGDLLPGATRDQIIATGFNRNHRGNSEGGIVLEEYLAEYSVDRVDTASTVWMGLTVGCARCHDHKYDPLKQREYYQLFAYFNNIPERGRIFKEGNTPPLIAAPTPEQQAELKALDHAVAEAKAELSFAEGSARAEPKSVAMTSSSREDREWFPERHLVARHALNDGELGPVTTAAAFDGEREIPLDAEEADFRYRDRFTISAWIRPESPDGAIVAKTNPDLSDQGYGYRGWGIYLVDGKLKFLAMNRWLDDGLRVATEASVPMEEWSHVAAVYDGSRFASGVQLFINGVEQETVVELDLMNINFRVEDPLLIGKGGGLKHGFIGRIDEVRIYDDDLDKETVAALSVKTPWFDLEPKTEAEHAKHRLGRYERFGPKPLREAWEKVAELEARRKDFVADLPTVMVMEERPEVGDTFLLQRGAYDAPGEKVERGVPSVLPPMPEHFPKNRLGLAQWLVSPEHPLTARVAVNRYWQMLFGRGIVPTVEDFGSQGKPPSHPELLDWLAVEFVESGWNVKRLLRTMALSATYRQSSRAIDQRLEADPDNVLLARGPRLRLPAEMVRDQALFVSGLLVEKRGGPSVKPYQPEGLWKELSGQTYKPDSGEALYRRSLYTFWKRSSPPPFMMNFDSAGREACTVTESRTNTPLQALNLMNDVTYVEAARKLAERMMAEAKQPDARIALGFRALTAREPKPAEAKILRAAFDRAAARYGADRPAAEALLAQGESPRDESLDPARHAAYTYVASLLFNLDETITKE